MKTRTVSIKFTFVVSENGVVLVGTKPPFQGKVYSSKLIQEFETTMPFRSFRKNEYGSEVMLLSDEQLTKVFQEDELEMSWEDLKKMFTFGLRQGQLGHIYLEKEFDRDATLGERVDQNMFVVAQFVRFGIVNRTTKKVSIRVKR